MHYKNIMPLKIILLTAIILHTVGIMPMHTKIKLTGTTSLAVAIGTYCYDHKKKFDQSYASKQLLYLGSLQNIKILTHHHIPSNASKSPTYNHIVALHKTTWPDRPIIESFDQKYDDILTEYYPDGPLQLPKNTKVALCAAIKSMIWNEISSSEKNYSVYHGTQNTAGILFRTMLNKQIYPNTPDDYFVLRDYGTINPLACVDNLAQHISEIRKTEKKKLQEEYTKDYGQNGRLEYVGQLFGGSPSRNNARQQIRTPELSPEYNNALLSVNRAALANSYPADTKGSNSLRFLTYIQPINSIWSIFFTFNSEAKAMRDILEIKNTMLSYGADPSIVDKHMDTLKKLCSKTGGMLIQFEVPKEYANQIVVCESFNNPICSAEQQLASMQKPLPNSTIREIDYKHMVMPLSIFNNPTSGIKMHAIIHADEATLSELLKTFDEINKEIALNNSHKN